MAEKPNLIRRTPLKKYALDGLMEGGHPRSPPPRPALSGLSFSALCLDQFHILSDQSTVVGLTQNSKSQNHSFFSRNPETARIVLENLRTHKAKLFVAKTLFRMCSFQVNEPCDWLVTIMDYCNVVFFRLSTGVKTKQIYFKNCILTGFMLIDADVVVQKSNNLYKLDHSTQQLVYLSRSGSGLDPVRCFQWTPGAPRKVYWVGLRDSKVYYFRV